MRLKKRGDFFFFFLKVFIFASDFFFLSSERSERAGVSGAAAEEMSVYFTIQLTKKINYDKLRKQIVQ